MCSMDKMQLVINRRNKYVSIIIIVIVINIIIIYPWLYNKRICVYNQPS